jgi:hypothetical protein
MTDNKQVMKNRCVCNQGKILSATSADFQCDCHHKVKSMAQSRLWLAIFSVAVGGASGKLMI